MPHDLHDLPRIEDGWSYLYVEHCKIDKEQKAIAIHDADGRISVPCASLALLMLGPGTSVTHDAVKTMADSGCLAVWCGYRCKSESGKLIMIFWCLFAFITCGFEHSVANMTLLTVGMISPFESAVSLTGYLYNISVVSLGNMVGGILFLAVPYFIIAKKKEV